MQIILIILKQQFQQCFLGCIPRMVKGLSWSGLSGWGWCRGSKLAWISDLQGTLTTGATNDASKAPEHWDPRDWVCVFGEGGVFLCSPLGSHSSRLWEPRNYPSEELKSVPGGMGFWRYREANGCSQRHYKPALFPVVLGPESCFTSGETIVLGGCPG